DRVEAGVDKQRLQRRKLLQVPRVNRVHLLLRTRDRHPGFQAADVLEIVAVSLVVTALFWCERQWTPEQHIRAQKREVLRHDADHRHWLAVKAKFLANRRRIAAELRLPECVADHGRRIAANLPILVTKRPSQQRADS